MLTTLEPGLTTIKRKIKTKDGVKTVWTISDVACTTTIVLYNSGMGGCDRSDQVMSYYLRHMQSGRPYIVLFFYFFLTAANSARVLHGKKTQAGGTPLPTKTWYDRLKNALLLRGQQLTSERKAAFHPQPAPQAAPSVEEESEAPKTRRHKWSWWTKAPAELRTTGPHNPLTVLNSVDRGRCIMCSATTKTTPQTRRLPKAQESAQTEAVRLAALRRAAGGDNMYLGAIQGARKGKISSMCRDCDVFLCFPHDDSGTSCWDLWHDLPSLNGVRV